MNLIDNELKELIENKLRREIVGCKKIDAGMNNKLLKLVDPSGKRYLLKHYFKDEKNRLWREFNAIKVMREQGFKNVPEGYLKSDQHHVALYSFEEGVSKKAKDITENEIEEMAKFLADLKKFDLKKLSVDFPPSVLACLSMDRYIYNIDFRINEFLEYLDNNPHPIIKQKLRKIGLKKMIGKLKADALSGLSKDKIESELPDNRKQLCPIDFGPHNILVDSDGKVKFIDFEYFGVDDPARVVTDFIMHDRSMNINDRLKKKFKKHYLDLINAEEDMVRHINRVEKLVAIEWLAIYLYSVMPVKIDNRKFSEDFFDEEKYINQQIDKFTNRLSTFSL